MEVKKLFDSSKSYKYNKTLHRNSDGEKALKQLQKDFVLIPVDKAGNIIAIICKYYYISTLKEEITSANFSAVNSNIEDIPNAHKQFLNKFSIEVDNKHSKLPFLYFTAKMHKTPVSSRFITSSKFSSLSKLSEKVCMCLNTA